MKLIVNPHKIELVQEQAVNEKEINVSECIFEFAEEITDSFVKEAYFTLGDASYKKIIANNRCTFPQEVLVKPATIELGVVAYLVENEEEITRYNPTPVYFKTDLGSLKDAENSEEITPSEMEQFEQALQDGLEEVANVDIDANKVGNTATITITNRYGVEKSVQVKDGDKGDKGDTGATGSPGPAGRDGYVQYTAGENITIENNVISAVGGSGTPDNVTIRKNASDELETFGIYTEQNSARKIWEGTISQYNDLVNNNQIEPDTYYYITDDAINNGVKSGGTTGQVLAKKTNADYDTEWVTQHSFSHETWTFTLDDNSTIDKEVTLW